MKRIVLWALSTLSTLVVLFGYHTSTSSVMASGTGVPLSGSLTAQAASGSGTTTSGGAPPDGSSTTDGSTSGSSGSGGSSDSSGPSGSAGSSGAASTVTGTAAQTRYGPVQVQIDVTGSTITNVSVLQYPSTDGRDLQISNYALPQLIQETLDQQSGSVSMISGATFTSQGYLTSLQSALDQAGL